MDLQSLFREIESHEFAAYLGVTSNLNTFLRVAFEQEIVRTLCDALDSRENFKEVIFRIHELSKKSIDERYENPSDTALAIYVQAIYLKDLELGQIAAEIALKAPQTWWTSKVKVLQEYQISSQSNCVDLQDGENWKEVAKIPLDVKVSSAD